MSILTKTSRRRTCFEGYSYLQRKVSMSNQLQSQCCKQDPSSDKRLHCTKSSKKGVVADFVSYKEAGRHLANTTIKAQPYKSLSANDEGSLPFHTKGLLLAERKKMPGEYNLHQASFSSVIDKNVITSFYNFLAIAQFHYDVLTIVCNHETFCASSVGYQQCATATDNVGQFFVFKHSSIKFVSSLNDKSPCTPQPRQVVQRQDSARMIRFRLG